MLVSFIIPSYNSAHTVVRCLDSIYALPLKQDEFEVIFIDDCSSDNTVRVIEDYLAKVNREERRENSNFTLLKQPENKRQGAARNRGVKVAKGEYICFVDSDDAVMEGIVDAIRLAKEKRLDMVALHYENVNEKGEKTSEAKKLSFGGGQIFTGIEMQNKHPYWCSAPWGYIYCREFLNRVNYPFAEGVLFEDSDFVVMHLYRANRMAYMSRNSYRVYWMENSSTHNVSYKNHADYLLLGTRMLSIYERIKHENDTKKGLSEELKEYAEIVLSGACWNIEKACRRLIKLRNINEVKAFYNRVDDRVDRMGLYEDERLRRYCWNKWTSLCVGYKNIAISVLTILIPMYKTAKKISR